MLYCFIPHDSDEEISFLGGIVEWLDLLHSIFPDFFDKWLSFYSLYPHPDGSVPFSYAGYPLFVSPPKSNILSNDFNSGPNGGVSKWDARRSNAGFAGEGTRKPFLYQKKFFN